MREIDLEVGERLRRLREGRGLSQRQLALRAGVTNGMISLIEQNRTSPSVALLRKILQGFPISLAEFFSQDLPPADRVFYRADQLVELSGRLLAPGGPVVSRRQVGNLEGRSLQILHERYPPGADTGPDMLQHVSEEGGVVVRGRIELTVGDQTESLGPGDAYLFDSTTPHRFRNVSDGECQLISACTPPYL
ncbi:MAG: cupin domain-containing protein [Azospirillum sp.]|nr:cupin domain-containing protein [Azospirillum sp.]